MPLSRHDGDAFRMYTVKVGLGQLGELAGGRQRSQRAPLVCPAARPGNARRGRPAADYRVCGVLPASSMRENPRCEYRQQAQTGGGRGAARRSLRQRPVQGRPQLTPASPNLPASSNLASYPQIRPCSKRYSHDWQSCPYAHPGERAARRDPKTHAAVACTALRDGGSCPLGDACPNAHNLFEYW